MKTVALAIALSSRTIAAIKTTTLAHAHQEAPHERLQHHRRRHFLRAILYVPPPPPHAFPYDATASASALDASIAATVNSGA